MRIAERADFVRNYKFNLGSIALLVALSLSVASQTASRNVLQRLRCSTGRSITTNVDILTDEMTSLQDLQVFILKLFRIVKHINDLTQRQRTVRIRHDPSILHIILNIPRQ
jgi:hypothetical protein